MNRSAPRILGATLVAGAGVAGGVLLFRAAPAPAAPFHPYAWLQLGHDGELSARVVVEGAVACPTVTLASGATAKMQSRGVWNTAPVAVQACAYDTTTGVTDLPVQVSGTTASGAAFTRPLPKYSAPQQVLVLGDTGCRVSKHVHAVQDCTQTAPTSPTHWPFAAVATEVANKAATPSVVVHVGDYIYRESCPAGATCPTPLGTSWGVWEADFFAPAEALLAAAPIAFVRGNHEDCARAFEGWSYLLSQERTPYTQATCRSEKPWATDLGGWQLVVVDSSAEDWAAAGLDTLGGFVLTDAVLASHVPLWGPGDALDPGRSHLETIPATTAYVVAGHAHAAEAVVPPPGTPPVFVLGNGGTALDGTGCSAPAGCVVPYATGWSAQKWLGTTWGHGVATPPATPGGAWAMAFYQVGHPAPFWQWPAQQPVAGE